MWPDLLMQGGMEVPTRPTHPWPAWGEGKTLSQEMQSVWNYRLAG